MKLIDLLVKELPKRYGWPAAANYVVQDHDGTVKFSKSIDFLHIKAGEWCSSEDGDDWIYSDRPFEGNFHHYITANDLKVSIVTREQYESALAASDGWIEWGGGECPVESSALVDLKFRNGVVEIGHNASAYYWENANLTYDIIAYRPHKQDINSRAKDDRLEQDLNECIGQGVKGFALGFGGDKNPLISSAWNGDGVPPVGIECEVKWTGGKWEKCEVLFVGIEKVVVDMRNREAAMSLCDVKFRPLRTEAEKAREKLAASLHIAAGASPIELNGIGPLYFELADAIISGSVFGTTFKADK